MHKCVFINETSSGAQFRARMILGRWELLGDVEEGVATARSLAGSSNRPGKRCHGRESREVNYSAGPSKVLRGPRNPTYCEVGWSKLVLCR
eukprot:768411-Hanusia_phi.AAC.8